MSDQDIIKHCLVIGVGSPYTYEVYESLTRAGWTVTAYIDNQNRREGPSDLGPVCNLADAPDEWLRLPAFIPPLTPGYRKAIMAQARDAGFSHFPVLADPTAVIARTAHLANATLVNAAAIVGAKSRLDEAVIVNRGASVGHHAVIENYATLGPGCILCGSSVIGAGAFIGAGAVLNPGVNIGANAIIGAGAVVTKDVPARSVAVGNPARIVKEDVNGYNNVCV